MSMTESEAIRRLKDHFRVHDDGRPTPYLDEAVSMAIKALEKVQALEENKTYSLYREYLSIGTVSEFRELKEKATAIKSDGFSDHLLNMGHTKGMKDGYAKAIEEFAERLCTVCCGESIGVILGNRVKADMLTVDGVCELAYEIAEAMKGE